MKSPPSSIEVLVVDDSAVVRQLMTGLLSAEPAFRVSTAADPLVAMAKMKRGRPAVILLDLEMPRMDGLTFLKRTMEFDPVPVVVCSGFAGPGTRLALRALEAGAVDIAVKPRVTLGGTVDDHGLLDIVRAAAQARVVPRRSRFRTGTFEINPTPAKPLDRRTPSTLPAFRPRADLVVAIGASTGGTEALREVLRGMPAAGPAIVIVQHMPEGFTAAFAEHLDAVCPMIVREARHGDRVQPGLALVGPGNRHLRVVRRGPQLVVDLSSDPPVSRHRPSVDVLFRSVAQAVNAAAIGVIMTGMGADGAEGLLEMKRAGAATIAQDEATCIVFGMPKEAIDRGAVDVVLPLPRIASGILQRVGASTAGQSRID
jgi:two-component system, chemotaxis family, protein-glutamate methylesterase/glutaminase